MDRKLFFKLLAIGGVTFMLMIALFMIEGQIRQRSDRQAEVLRNIAETAAGPQTLAGPVLAVRYLEKIEPEVREDKETGQKIRIPRVAERVLLLPAETLSIQGGAEVETRYRGIYQAQLYHLDLALQGKIVLPANLGLQGKNISDLRATLVLGLSDLRGVDSDPAVTLNGQARRFTTPNTQAGAILEKIPGQQMHLELGPVTPGKDSVFEFAFPLKLTGTERFAIAPTAETNHIHLVSPWAHPSFQGRYLPRSREVGKKGFDAAWEISHLARDFTSTTLANASHVSGPREILEISFMQPVNVYQQAERAVKYGSLFILLTFAAFFLREVIRRSPMHPMQYLLAGLALAIFFLLLIALSEHLAFAVSYGISAAACIALITLYLAGALGGRLTGLAFGAGLTGLYGVLYGVLLSEDNALLMGSLLLFIALGAIMLATRRLDWYALNGPRDDDAKTVRAP